MDYHFVQTIHVTYFSCTL